MDGSLEGKGMDVCLLWEKGIAFFFLGDIIMQGTDRNSFSNVGVQFC